MKSEEKNGKYLQIIAKSKIMSVVPGVYFNQLHYSTHKFQFFRTKSVFSSPKVLNKNKKGSHFSNKNQHEDLVIHRTGGKAF